MSCKPTLTLLIALVGCTDDPRLLEVTVMATEQIELRPATSEGLSKDDATYHWDLVVKPDDSNADAPLGEMTALFVPDLRGTYLVERWLQYGLADRVTHQFVIHAMGTIPLAVVRGETSLALGSTSTLDASESRSPEGLALRYQWRLAERPRDSIATLVDAQSVTSSFIPDVVGNYVVELAVFDGLLWSEAPATITVAVQ
jgi:hypothetical protein